MTLAAPLDLYHNDEVVAEVRVALMLVRELEVNPRGRRWSRPGHGPCGISSATR